MADPNLRPAAPADLRAQAEAIAGGDAARSLESTGDLSPQALQRALHELRVHQIQLEMQNEELQRAVAELEARRERYVELYDDAPVGYVTVSDQGLILEANLTAAGMLGAVRDDLVHQPFSRFVLPEDQERCLRLHRQLLATGGQQAWDLRLSQQDGTARWVHLQARAAKGPGGAPICRWVMSDLTERKRAEESLGEARHFSEQITTSANEGIILYGPDLRYQVWNPFMEQFTGVPAGAVLGRHPLELFPFLESGGVIEQLEKVLAGEPVPGPRDFPFHVASTGRSGWASDVNIPLRNPAGGIVGVIGLVRDITRRKESELALEETTLRLRLATASAGMGVWDWNIQSGAMTWDDRMLELYGITREAFSGTVEAWKDGLHPEDLDRAMAECAAALRGEAPYNTEFRVKHPDGVILWIKADGLILRDEHGSPVRMIGLNWDLTGRKRTEQALADSETLYRSLFRNLLNGFAYCRMLFEGGEPRDFIYLAVNDAFEAQTGLKSVTGRKVSEVIPGILEADPELIATYGRVARSGIPERFEVFVEALQMWFAISVYSPVAEHFVAIFDVITERKLAEKALLERELRYRNLTELSPDAIWVNRDDHIIMANSEALRLLGVESADQLEGRSPFEFFHPDCHEKVRERIAAARQGRIVRHSEEAILRQDGTVRQVEVSSARFEDSLGPGIQIVLRDVTERKQIERERSRLEAQLQQAQKMESLGTLVAGVAHNINNVLNVIMGTASLREDQTAEPSDQEAYRIIEKACRRGRDVVKSLIHFAKPTLSLQAPLELHALIQEVCALMQSTTRDRVRLIQAFAGEPLWINGDAGSISHVLVNLGINAIDALPGGGTLTFRTRILEGDQVEVCVEDNGGGMAPEVLGRALEPFYTTKEPGRGTGLGLSMTYGVVKAHGGTLDIASQPGQGTAVKLRFPRTPAPGQAETVNPPAPSPPSMRVFLVDDDEDVRFLMTRMLRQAGVRQLRTFAGGDGVLAALRSEGAPDLIILDQNMPGLNGVQTLDRIRQLHPDLPILISSGQPDIEAWEVFKRPNVGVISKPFNLEEIQAKLAQFGGAARPG